MIKKCYCKTYLAFTYAIVFQDLEIQLLQYFCDLPNLFFIQLNSTNKLVGHRKFGFIFL